MSLPNLLTLLRVPLVFLTALAYDLGWFWVAFTILIVSGLTDWLDGFVARRMGLVSDFGKLMDALVDKVFVLGLYAFLAARQDWPDGAVYAVIVVLAREFLVSGVRMMAASKGWVMPAEKLGKYKTVAQFVSLGALLLVPAWPEASEVFRPLGLAFLAISALLAVISGWGYATALARHSGTD